jgi:hypothetical protein
MISFENYLNFRDYAATYEREAYRKGRNRGKLGGN